MIGYPRGQDGLILTVGSVPAKVKFFGVIFWPYKKTFIDQACSVKMAGYWLFAFLWTSSLSRPIKMQKKIMSNIQSSSLVDNAYIYGLSTASQGRFSFPVWEGWEKALASAVGFCHLIGPFVSVLYAEK